MRAFFDPATAAHAPQFMLVRGQVGRCFEVPERSAALLSALDALGIPPEVPERHGMAPVEAVHDAGYLDFLRTIQPEWEAAGMGAEVIPNVHALGQVPGPATCPRGLQGRAGWYILGSSAPVAAGTWEAALRSADTAVTAAQAVLAGERAYALCRPPGHHAYTALAGGFCYLNNSAIAAEVLRAAHERVAILDVDIHHGNGTQGVFWERGDVLTVSVHSDPMDFYPWYWGHAEERGAGLGEGANLNLPLPMRAPDDRFLETVREALAAIDRFDPGAVVIALGLDAHEDDPLRGGGVTTAGFRRIGALIGAIERPVLLVQEGGYLTPALGANLESFLRGFLGR